METILVDTSVWINFFKDIETPTCKYLDDNFTSLIIATCPTVIQEILQGVVSEKQKHIVSSYFDNLNKLVEEPYQLAKNAAEIYRYLRTKGITIRKPNDCLIAAYAISTRTTLLEDDRDFKHIAQYFPLKIIVFH